MVLEDFRKKLFVWANATIAAYLFDKFNKLDDPERNRIVRYFLSGNFKKLAEYFHFHSTTIDLPTNSLVYNARVTELKKRGYDVS